MDRASTPQLGGQPRHGHFMLMALMGQGAMRGMCGPMIDQRVTDLSKDFILCPVPAMDLYKPQTRKFNSFSSLGKSSHSQSFSGLSFFSYFPWGSHFSVTPLKPASALYITIFNFHETRDTRPRQQTQS